jgi:hypothetical protein
MPKNEIDYSNTIIYKICCKNLNISDMYVGHTTNFIKRKYHHKSCCIKLNTKLNIYTTIRETGGWDNWDMIEVAKYNCKNKNEAHKKEQHHYEDLKSTLSNNLQSHLDIHEEYFCDVCCSKYYSKQDFNFHANCVFQNKLPIEQNRTKKMPKNADIFYCEKCDFKCFKKSNFVTHNLSLKHKNRTLLNIFEQENAGTFSCKYCDKTYRARNSAWYHEKKCEHKFEKCQKMPDNNENNIILTLLQQNNQLQTQIIDMCKEKRCITNINTGTHINSQNNTFNLNVFLNETCKDAMNITDFVDSLKLQLSDLENMGKLGYVEGISNIIVKNLNKLDVHKRPVHCSDSKREVMYIKDENKWEKENEKKKNLRTVIKKIADKNSRLLPEFKAKYPDYIKSTSPFSDQYNKIIVESMGGSGDNDLEKEDKIIKKIAKNVKIDKIIEIDFKI